MNRRLAAWGGLIAVFAIANYSARAAGGEPDQDALYKYATGISGAVQYLIILGVVLLIVRGLPLRATLGLRRPVSLLGALGLAGVVLVGTYAVAAAVEAVSDPGREQGLTPEHWDSSRALPFAVNALVVAGVAPAVEELAFRGAGYSLLRPHGRLLAILWIGIAFGLIHGLLAGLPILIAFGAGLAWLRDRTESVYPCIALHALFNAAALTLSVTT